MNDGQDIGALSALYELCNWSRQMNYIGPSVQRKRLTFLGKEERTRPNYWTKSRQKSKEFSPCYSQSPLQLCLEISISSHSRNLLQFLQFSYCNGERRKT
jgi:hypothetical protein